MSTQQAENASEAMVYFSKTLEYVAATKSSKCLYVELRPPRLSYCLSANPGSTSMIFRCAFAILRIYTITLSNPNKLNQQAFVFYSAAK